MVCLSLWVILGHFFNQFGWFESVVGHFGAFYGLFTVVLDRSRLVLVLVTITVTLKKMENCFDIVSVCDRLQ